MFNKKLLSYLLLIGLSLTILSLIPFSKADNPPSIPWTQWSKTYGGPGDEEATSMIQTNDDGYAIVGDMPGIYYSSQAILLIKTDVYGNQIWNKTYENGSEPRSIIQTNDNGYAILGTSNSGLNSGYALLIKTDATGNQQWNKPFRLYGSSSLVQTKDNGYALTGYTGGPPPPFDVVLIKTDSQGNQMWNKTFGEKSSYEFGGSIIQTNDGIAVLGSTVSPGFYSWLIKMDAMGNKLWNKTYQGIDVGRLGSLIQTNDDGYALAGTGSQPYGSFLVKTDAYGNQVWNKTYASVNTNMRSFIQTSDDGYALLGGTESLGYRDFWLFKMDASGNQVWNKTFGGPDYDYGWSIVQTKDNTFTLAGYTRSFGAGGYDFWLVKTAPTLTTLNSDGGQLYPSVGTYSVPEIEGAAWLIAHPDVGYSFNYFVIDGIKTSAQYIEDDGDYTYYLNMDTSHTVQAIFTTGNPVAPTLTVYDNVGGQMYPQPGTYMSPNIEEYMWLIAHPNVGYKFSHFLIDGIVTPAQYIEDDGDYTYYLSMDTSHTVQAVFTVGAPIFSTLTVLDSVGGTTYPSPGTYISSELGDDAAWLIAHPNIGYKFNYFLIDGTVTPNQYFEQDGDYTYYLRTDTSHTVQAIFAPS